MSTTPDPRITTAELRVQDAQAEIDRLATRQQEISARLGEVEQSLADLRAQRSSLLADAAQGAPVDLTPIRARLSSLELEREELPEMTTSLQPHRVMAEEALTQAEDALRLAHVEITMERAHRLKDELNVIGRQYEAKWRELADVLAFVHAQDVPEPPWISNARNEIRSVALTFNHTPGGRYVRLPEVGNPRYA